MHVLRRIFRSGAELSDFLIGLVWTIWQAGLQTLENSCWPLASEELCLEYITPRGWGWINMLWWTREGEEEGKGGFFRAGLGGEWLAGD